MKTSVLAALIMTVETATITAAQAQSVRLDGQIVKTGMMIEGVLAAAGHPTSTSSLVNEFGGPEGQVLFYRFDGYNKRTVVIQANAFGEVVRIEECLGQKADGCR
ncbi:hypothetical protein [Panacagrimonas sp.]|uniref:hypothetical protein n=1 Tax=Panacagrimonas sp. TaxID=2480088 RepID=UPI003B523784